MTSLINKGVGLFTSNLVNSYRKIGDGIVATGKNLCERIGFNEILYKEKCQAIASAALITLPILIQNGNDLKKDFTTTFNRWVRIQGIPAILTPTMIAIQKLIVEHFGNNLEIDEESLSTLGVVTVAVTGGAISLIAMKVMARLRSLNEAFGVSIPKQIELLCSSILISSVVTTAASSVLFYAFESKAEEITSQLACGASLAILTTVLSHSRGLLEQILIIPTISLAPTLTVAVHHKFGLASPLIALLVLASHQGNPFGAVVRSFEFEREEILALAHSGWIAGNAIHPLVGLGLSGLLNISYLTVNEVARRSHFVGTQATFNKNVETMGKKIWAENTQVLVNEHLLSDLSSLVMDYADEVNPPRLAPYALIKGPSAQAMKGLMDRIA